jgi:valyl-tRNA synthetase
VALAAWRNIFAVLDAALRLLHPVMPFLTEELWHKLPQPAGARSIALDRFPEPRKEWFDPGAEHDMAKLQEFTVKTRNARAENKIEPKKQVVSYVVTNDPSYAALISRQSENLLAATYTATSVVAGPLNPSGGMIYSTSQFDLQIPFGEGVEKSVEIARLKKESERLAKDIESKKTRLADETFLSKAPAKIVEDLKATLTGREIEYQKLLARLKQLE